MAIRLTGMSSGLDTEAMVTELVKAYETKGESNVKEKTKMEWKQDIWKDLNKKIKSFSTKLNSMRYESNYNVKKTTTTDDSKVSVIASDNAVKGSQSLEVKNLAKAAYLTGGQVKDGATGKTTLKELGFSGSGETITIKKGDGTTKDFTVNEDTTIDEFVKFAKTAGYNANFDSSTGRIFMNSTESGKANDFTLEGNSDALKALGLNSAGGVTKIDGQDAKIILNGAEFTSSSNTFQVNGLTITAKGVTKEGDQITLNTDTDYDKIYDNIKGVIKEYSTLINELDKLYNASSAKDYEPLTDEEKEAMSDDEIEKWETKIKDSLLRRDSNVDSVRSALKNATNMTYTINGKTMSLSDFGIGTLGYFTAGDNEKNMLHIDGNADDDATMANSDKLKAMISGNPEDTAKFFSKYFNEMSTNLSNISKTSSTRSFGNFYDDKKVASDLKKQETKISDWEDYVKEVEDRYYKQFTEMEYQMTKLNNTQTSVSGLFGS